MADGDIWNSFTNATKTVAINESTSGDRTIHIVTPGRRFCVYSLWLQAEAGVDVIFKSGATALTAPITFAANAEKDWGNSGVPCFVGRAVGDNFVMNLSGNIQVNGFFVITELHTAPPI